MKSLDEIRKSVKEINEKEALLPKPDKPETKQGK